ncbi:voltage-dependent t-type calcium channel subunit alpha-1h [Limosa lapponica baueri]|uniref:Voltage-dependent t-type calcium channel subunit alpha-1h n=1 Tax=Limosa lapponica baueri TaxID=1758121 RepID=A0A2I0TE79_LIMLA|nr:voltage-dependent t-type calcium channel subunit alpha-1h [Limosa lapponica baueri]
MLVILLNCVTLGMFQPCEDVECQSERCTILEYPEALGKCQSTQIFSPCMPKISISSRFLSGISGIFLACKCDTRTRPQA